MVLLTPILTLFAVFIQCSAVAIVSYATYPFAAFCPFFPLGISPILRSKVIFCGSLSVIV